MSEEIINIEEKDLLLRRAIYNNPSYIKDDMTLTSFAFKLRKGEDGLSVEIEKLTTYEQSIVDKDKYRLFAIKAGDIRSLGLDCKHTPMDGNYPHAEIVGKENKINNSASSKLAKLSIFINYPAT